MQPDTRREEPARRRRNDIDTVGRRLAVNTSILDFEKYVYRYINDTAVRLFSKTRQDDWNIVTQKGMAIKEDSTDLGDAVSVIVGSKPDGSPLRAYLCRKLRKFYEDDEKQKQTDLDEQLKQLRLGNSAKGEKLGDYDLKSGIKIA